MKKLLLILFAAVLYAPAANAQPVYEIDDVSHMLLYSHAMITLKMYESDTYAKRYIVSVNPFSIHESASHDSKEKLAAEGGTIISIDELSVVPKEEWTRKFLKQEYVVAKSGKDSFQTWEMLLPNIWIERHYKFDRSPYDYQAPPGWRVDVARVFDLNFIMLPNGKLYMQGGNNFILPREYGFYNGMGQSGYFDEKFDPSAHGPAPEFHIYETLAALGSPWEVVQRSDKKYELRYRYGGGDELLGVAYDAIDHNSFFVIGELDGKYDIYNTLAQKIEDKADGVNFDSERVYYVKNSRLHVKNVAGGDGSSLKITRFVCGTVPHYRYEIQRDEKGRAWLAGVYSDSFLMNSDQLQGKTGLGNDVYKWDDIRFLDGSDALFYDSNDLWFMIENTMGVGPNWLIYEQGGKFGIVEFIDGNEFSAREIVPAEYDKIEFRSYLEPLILYKGGLRQVLVGLYDDDNFGREVQLVVSPPFKSITEQSKFYLRYQEEDGAEGWYDISKGACIADKWQDRLSIYRSSLEPESF